ncbi:MAG TPA: gamma-glutamylcyclotransferase [Ideonella sp.]|nr:gamma-glutamylcyclotransferase [Ideonella sp.]
MFQVDPSLIVRDPQALLQRTLQQWGGHAPLWVFAYGSLLWKREFDADEHRAAQAHGWHRAFRMQSRVNRGSPQLPGLVFALMAGGSCHGAVYRLPERQTEAVMHELWDREMSTGVYDARWIRCQTEQGTVSALAFTLSHQSPGHTGTVDDARMLQILREARGRYGSTLDYLVQTALELRARGIRDREIERLLALARRHGLPTGAREAMKPSDAPA